MELGLKGKTALVSGASEGIGRAIAWKLAEEGVRVAIYARTTSKLKETATAISHATGMEIVPIPTDLRSLAGPTRVCLHSRSARAVRSVVSLLIGPN